MYYRGAQAAIVVFDLTAPASLERAKHWVQELRYQTPDVAIALAGNKTDLPHVTSPTDSRAKPA